MTTPGRERKTEREIAVLLSSRTLREAAETLGCSTRTLLRHLKHREFQRRYKAARDELLRHAMTQLRAQSEKAVGALADVSADGGAWDEPIVYKGQVVGTVRKFSPSAKVSAAGKILELALQSHQIEELEERIKALEKQLGEAV